MSEASPLAPHRPDIDPVLESKSSDYQLTTKLLEQVGRAPRGWWILIGIAATGTLWFAYAIYYLITVGIGALGNQIPVAWAFPITNFVWWIGIGHAGTFISAILYLLEQRWRTSINRFAEAMTIFAVMQAGLFPLLHLGRPWFAYWIIPYPATMGVWPQFKSALTWDAAAVFTYFTISVLFWYLGLVPDLAAARDTSNGFRRKAFAVFSLGWRGAARHWKHYKIAYLLLLLAGLATPLVISVHSVVSLDFAEARVPGWHSTIFPPYFVAGAIFSGFAMVLTLLVPCRAIFHLEEVITPRHLESMAKMLLVTGWVVTYTYIIEQFLAWYSGDTFEISEMFSSRPAGIYAFWFAVMIFGNVLVPQLYWFKRVRRSPWALFVTSIFINIGMWLERFIIIVTSLYREHIPSMWYQYRPTWVDFSLLFGSLCFFSLLFLILLRLVPIVPITETKEMRHEMASEHDEPTRAA